MGISKELKIDTAITAYGQPENWNSISIIFSRHISPTTISSIMDPRYPILYYLNRRQLGYDGIRKNVKELLIDKMGYKLSNTAHEIDTSVVYACKFSRNKNNLHMLGYSTGEGIIYLQPTLIDRDNKFGPIAGNEVHTHSIFNFSWAEPEMKLVTASVDRTSKLFSVGQTGSLTRIKTFTYDAAVRTVMFCPGSSDVFCGGAYDGFITIWDARLNNDSNVLEFGCKIPSAHGAVYDKKKKKPKPYGITSLLYINDTSIISSSYDNEIKVWDLRKTESNVNSYGVPEQTMKYYHGEKEDSNDRIIGFMDMITNPELTRLYASGLNNVIYCYSLESPDNNAICQFSGHSSTTPTSKISISNDGRYLFSGCPDKSGVMWHTDYPYVEQPFLNLRTKEDEIKELNASDWCADKACMKLATSADSWPNIWTICPYIDDDDLETETIRMAPHRLVKPKISITKSLNCINKP